MADALSPYEVASTGQEYGEDRRFVGIRVCRLLASQIPALRQHFDPAMGAAGYWPGAGGLFGARVWKYRLVKYDAARWDLLVWYRQPTPAQLVSPDRAMLTVKVAGRATRLKRETGTANRIIEGPVEAADGSITPNRFWALYKGDNIAYLGDTAELTLVTAFESPKIDLYLDYMDCINNAPLPNFGNAPAESVKFIGTSFGGQLIQQQYWGGRMHFLYKAPGEDDKSGWTCKVDQEKKIITTVENPDDAGAPKRTVMQSAWADKTHATAEDRNTYRDKKNFAAFNALLSWL